MISCKYAAAVAAGFVALCAAQAAAQGGPPPQPMPQGEGPLFLSPMGQPFRGVDRTAPIQIWFDAADANGDGRVDRMEFVGQAVTFFYNRLDANHDRAVTSLESSAFWREHAPELLSAHSAPVAVDRPPRQPNSGTPDPRGGREQRNPPAPAAAPSPMARFALFDIAEPVMSCDADMSRRVTHEEFEACAGRRFASLDANGDGVFTLDESPRAAALVQPPERRPRP